MSAAASSGTRAAARPATGTRRLRRPSPARWALGFLAIALGLVYVFPLAWAASASVRSNADVFSASLLPRSFRPANFPDAWRQFGLGTLFLHTTVITVGTVVISIGLAITAAYGFARFRSRLSEAIFLLILAGLAVPPIAVIVPFFLTMKELHLYDSLLAVVVGETAFVLPLAILILRGYIDQVPHELSDAAAVDGASDWRAFWSVVFPLLRAPIASVAFLIVVSTWNGFLLPLVLITDPGTSTVTVGLSTLSTQYGQVSLELVAAASVLAVVPVMVVFIAARRYYVQGLTAGAVKS